MAAVEFYFCSIFGMHVCRTSNVMQLPNFVQICGKVNELWAIDEKHNGGRRHLEFIILVYLGQMVYFRWQPSTFLQNFIHLRQSAAVLLLFVQKSKMAAAAMLDFIFVQYFGTLLCRTSNVIDVPNFVRIRAIINKLWAIDEIHCGGHRHLEFIIFVHFGQMSHFQWQPSILLQNFIHPRQSAAELLLFVPSWILFLFILVKCPISSGSPLYYCKISFIYWRLNYCCLCKNPRWRPPPY